VVPAAQPVVGLFLPSAGIGGSPIEARGTVFKGDREYLEDPSGPAWTVWYPDFGRPGRDQNTTFSAHVDYVGYGRGPFWGLVNAQLGDLLTLILEDGTTLVYSVQSVTVVPLDEIDMRGVLFPVLPPGKERVTLLTCGGPFVGSPGAGGVYTSRVLLVAERYR